MVRATTLGAGDWHAQSQTRVPLVLRHSCSKSHFDSLAAVIESCRPPIGRWIGKASRLPQDVRVDFRVRIGTRRFHRPSGLWFHPRRERERARLYHRR
jgi:hypothetical protein